MSYALTYGIAPVRKFDVQECSEDDGSWFGCAGSDG